MSAPPPPVPDPSHLTTSHHVRRAVLGDRESLSWMVSRFSPLLRAQARFRLGARQHADQDDIVSQAWLQALPKLATIKPLGERFTPSVLGYLSTIVRRLANQRLLSSDLGRPDEEIPISSAGKPRALTPFDEVRREAELKEAAAAISAAIRELDAPSRELIILRGVEGLSYAEISAEVGGTENTHAQRYRRALSELRSKIPESIFEEFDSE